MVWGKAWFWRVLLGVLLAAIALSPAPTHAQASESTLALEARLQQVERQAMHLSQQVVSDAQRVQWLDGRIAQERRQIAVLARELYVEPPSPWVVIADRGLLGWLAGDEPSLVAADRARAAEDQLRGDEASARASQRRVRRGLADEQQIEHALVVEVAQSQGAALGSVVAGGGGVHVAPAGPTATGFPSGYCTRYVADRWPVSWRGDAWAWASAASAQGYPVVHRPQPGAIVVYRPSGGYSPFGHVALVDSVGPGSFTVSEENYRGFGVVDTRRDSWPDPAVAGFILRK